MEEEVDDAVDCTINDGKDTDSSPRYGNPLES